MPILADTLDETILPKNDMLDYLPGNDTMASNKAVIAEETLQEFEHILGNQDNEDPSVIAHHIEEESLTASL